jgi:hypothetical protein
MLKWKPEYPLIDDQMNKRQKILLSALLIVIIASSVGALYFTETSINYGFNYDFYYKQENGKWYTGNWISGNRTDGMLVSVECHNVGQTAGAFSIVLEFTNAHFSNQTQDTYQQESSTKAKFPLSLQAGGNHAIDAYFTIDENVTQFEVKVSFEGNQPFIRGSESNFAGIDTMTFAYQTYDQTYHQINMVA